MLKRIISALLVVAIFAFVPAIVGCEQNEYKSQKHTEVHDQVIEQKEVVQ